MTDSRCRLLIDTLADVPEFFQEGVERKLASGATSTTYVDCRSLLKVPHVYRVAAQLAGMLVDGTQVCGVPEGATTLAALVAQAGRRPITMLRSRPKTHGAVVGKRVAVATPGMPVSLIEDTVTTGGSVVKAVEALAAEGLVVTQILSIVDRRPGAGPMQPPSMRALGGVPYAALWTLSEICMCARRRVVVDKLAAASGTELCLAADVHTVAELEALVAEVGGAVDVLKVHADLFPAEQQGEVRAALNRLRAAGTLVWDDRKFADIPKVVNAQVEDVATYADMVTVVPSEPLACHSTYFPLIALGHMTSWSQPSRELPSANADLYAGVVLRPSAASNPLPGKPVFMPGIKVDNRSTDSRGQSYAAVGCVVPNYAVVGRAIVNASDRKAAVATVRQALLGFRSRL